MEAETGVTQPQAKESLEPPDSGGGKKENLPTGLAGAQPCQHLEIRLLSSRSARRNLCCSKPHGNLSQQPQETNRAVNLISNTLIFMIDFQNVKY